MLAMTIELPAGDRQALAQMIAVSLHTADGLGLMRVGIALNDALVQLTGDGFPPPGWGCDPS